VVGPGDLPWTGVIGAVVDRLPFVTVDHGLTALQIDVLFAIRLPRVVLGGLVGAMLASGGAAYQGVFRNPLADPYLLGVAAGLIGLVAGLTIALFIQFASQPLLGHPLKMHLRPGVIAANLAAAVVVTALAAWLPARRAVKLDLLEAISAE
jgi:iron complex transport system permease protein